MHLPDQQEGRSDLHLEDCEKGNRAEIPIAQERPDYAARVYIDPSNFSLRIYGHANDEPVLCILCAKNETCDHDEIGKACHVPCG